MKRFVIIIISIMVLVLTPVGLVYADVVWGTDFTGVKEENLITLDRYLFADGKNGYIVTRETIDNKKEFSRFENGTIIRISQIYNHGGEYLGVEKPMHGSRPGWFPMKDLLLFYDMADFEAAHQNELREFDGDLRKLADAEAFYYWRWPGSDWEKRFFDKADNYVENEGIDVRHIWTDDEGRTWAYIIIYGGSEGRGMMEAGASQGWVCLDEPENGAIPAFNPSPEPVRWSPTEYPDWFGSPIPPAPPESKRESDPDLIINILIIAAAAVAAFLVIGVIKRKKV